jgi:hypothetical protein
MTRIANLPLALLLLTTALTGCLDGNDSTDLEETTIIQNSADIATLNEDIDAISDILDADLALIERSTRASMRSRTRALTTPPTRKSPNCRLKSMPSPTSSMPTCC